MGVKPLEVKRVGIAPMVKPITKLALQRVAKFTGLSQGELIDDGIAGMVTMYAESPLEEGEGPSRHDQIDVAMIEKATMRIPVRVEVDRMPVRSVETVTVEKLPKHLTSGANVELVPRAHLIHSAHSAVEGCSQCASLVADAAKPKPPRVILSSSDKK